jgi:hypothetical protein
MGMQDQESILRVCIDVGSFFSDSRNALVRAISSVNGVLVEGGRGSAHRVSEREATVAPAHLVPSQMSELLFMKRVRSGSGSGWSRRTQIIEDRQTE